MQPARLRVGAVYSLLGAIAAVIAPHLIRLPWWLALLVGACLLWQAAAAARAWRPLSRWLLAGMSIGATFAVVLAYGPVPGREGSVALLVLMAALKCLELRTVRDAQVTTLLGYFLIVTHFLYTQTAVLGVLLFGVLVWLVATNVAFQDRNRLLGPMQSLRTAGVLTAGAFPVALVLFFLFPRVEGPLFGHAVAGGAATTGLDDSMSPGDIVDLGLSDEVAFRVEFEGNEVPLRDMYWRGPVMTDFDGRTWRTARRARTAATLPPASPQEIRYRVTLEPHRRRWLFALDVPLDAPLDAMLGEDMMLRTPAPVATRTRYEVRSTPDYRLGLDARETARRRALRLPLHANPRAVQLGRALRSSTQSELEVVDAALAMFRDEPFHYTLAPPALGAHSVDEFLFETRRGFCEHYASAFAVLMRAAGIPSRIVTGYHGGEHNRVGNYLIVRQSHAHAWTEIWLRERGWVRIDPTTAIAPSRIEASSTAPWRSAEWSEGWTSSRWVEWLNAEEVFDHMTRTWNDWVLDYSPTRQRDLLRDAGFGEAHWQRVGGLLAVALAIVLAVLVHLTLRRTDPRPSSRVQQLYAQFCRKLERVGCIRHAHEGPYDFARRASERFPILRQAVERITETYVSLRYAEAGSATTGELEVLVRRFAPRRALRQSGARY